MFSRPYLNYKFHIFSTQYLQHPILYNILALTLYLIILWLIRLPFRHLHRTSIQQIYDSHKSTVLFKRRGLDHKSVISNSKVKYELLLLIRNPPVSIGVILLMVALSMGLFGVMIFIIENNNDFTNYKNSALAYPLVMLPGIITSYMIQPFVSFDLDGKMMQLKKNNDVFILNKIVVKEIISLIFNLILFGIYLTLTLLFLKKPFSLLSMIIVFFSYVLISISIVTSTIAFPNFKWNFFYEIPSTLSKILLAVVLGGILLIGIAGVLADGYFSILVIITQIILIIFLLMINRSLWKKTIHKNFFSFRLLRE